MPDITKSLRQETRLANWRTSPYNQWAFHHAREILPTAAIAAPRRCWQFPRRPLELESILCTDRHGSTRTLAQLMTEAHTDAVLAVHRGSIVYERYFHQMRPGDPHILMSVSKSVTASLAGILCDRGVLAPDEALTAYMPMLSQTGFAGATLQQLLDMRVGLDFDEDYYVDSGPMIEYREATGWNPRSATTPPGGLHAFLLRQQANRPHGGAFQYTSPNSDLLGWLLEHVTGQSMAELLSEHLWGPLGAEFDAYVTVDPQGASRTAGGINVTARDLARVGQAMLQHGVAEHAQVFPQWWVTDTTTGGDEDAWREGNFRQLLPAGRYRNKWYQYGDDLGAYCAIGIHGQFLYVAPQAGVVIVHFASHPEPFNEGMETTLLDALGSIARHLNDTP